jgi:hypothetical protein
MVIHRRDLTSGEMKILGIIQNGYGSNNTADKVFFTRTDEAAIAVEDSTGNTQLMANLTNLAAWRADGTILTDDVLRKDWLRLG